VILKKTISFTLVMLLLLIMANIGLAENELTVSEILTEDSIENSLEKEEITQVIYDSLDHIEELVTDVVIYKDENDNLKRVKPEKSFESLHVNLENATKLHGLKYKYIYENYDNVLQAYNDCGSFSDLIAKEDYSWHIPIYDENGNLVTYTVFAKGEPVEEAIERVPILTTPKFASTLERIKEKEGKWYLSTTGGTFSENRYTFISFISDKNRIEKFLENEGLKNIRDVRYVKGIIPITGGILYVKDGDDEYGIPFNQRTEFTGLENMKLYKISKILEVAETQYDNYKSDW